MSSSSNHVVGMLPELDDLPALGLTERELFTIFMKYSDSDIDPELAQAQSQDQLTVEKNDRPTTADGQRPLEQPGAAEGLDSSPESQNEREHDSSQITCSTAHTTPLKHWMMRNQARQQTQYAEFVALCTDSDLPDATKSYLKSLASQVVEIGGMLQNFAAREGKEEAEDIMLGDAEVLIRLLRSSSNNCSGQIANISWLQELVAFSVVPTDMALWSNYRQRVGLVTRHLTLPSVTEHHLLERLLLLHDAYILSPLLHLTNPTSQTATTDDPLPSTVPATLLHLTSTLSALLTLHTTWLLNLRTFRTTHILPLQRRITSSLWVRREVKQAETSLATARLNLHRRYTSGEMKRILREDQLRGASMLIDRRSKSSVVGRAGLLASPRPAMGGSGGMNNMAAGAGAGAAGAGSGSVAGYGSYGGAILRSMAGGVSVVRDFAVEQEQQRGGVGWLGRRGTRARREHTM